MSKILTAAHEARHGRIPDIYLSRGIFSPLPTPAVQVSPARALETLCTSCSFSPNSLPQPLTLQVSVSTLPPLSRKELRCLGYRWFCGTRPRQARAGSFLWGNQTSAAVFLPTQSPPPTQEYVWSARYLCLRLRLGPLRPLEGGVCVEGCTRLPQPLRFFSELVQSGI